MLLMNNFRSTPWAKDVLVNLDPITAACTVTECIHIIFIFFTTILDCLHNLLLLHSVSTLSSVSLCYWSIKPPFLLASCGHLGTCTIWQVMPFVAKCPNIMTASFLIMKRHVASNLHSLRAQHFYNQSQECECRWFRNSVFKLPCILLDPFCCTEEIVIHLWWCAGQTHQKSKPSAAF